MSSISSGINFPQTLFSPPECVFLVDRFVFLGLHTAQIEMSQLENRDSKQTPMKIEIQMRPSEKLSCPERGIN